MRSVNQKLLNSRINICKDCPIFSEGICSRDLYLNPKTNDVSSSDKNGYIRGCGCKIFLKAKMPNAKCPAEK